MWADHGDAISLQYSGTNALKGDLTRTGKRTVGGLLQVFLCFSLSSLFSLFAFLFPLALPRERSGSEV